MLQLFVFPMSSVVRSHLGRAGLGELVAAEEDVLLPRHPEGCAGFVQPQHALVLRGRVDRGHVGAHRRVPAVVARGVGAHVDNGRVLGQRLPQVTREAGHKTLEISVAT